MAERAEIIFTPYNYLIDPNLRHAFGKKFDWKNAILLFDEAHNVEQACASVASFDLPAAHLAQAVREAQEAFELAAKEEEHDLAKNENEQTLRFNARGREKHDGFGGDGGKLGVNGMKHDRSSGVDDENKRTALDYKTLRGMLLALESKIARELYENGAGEANSKEGRELVKGPEHFFAMLSALKITDHASDLKGGGTVKMLTDLARCACVLLAGEAAGVGQKSKATAKSFRLTEVADALDKAFALRKNGSLDQFRLRIGVPPGDGGGSDFQNGQQNGQKNGSSNQSKATIGPTLSFWCFTPGVVMKALKAAGVRCVILTSGTLSPMTSFASELSIPFPIRLENPHVIQSDQVWGGVVPVGPSGVRLNSSYRFRDTETVRISQSPHSASLIAHTRTRRDGSLPITLTVYSYTSRPTDTFAFYRISTEPNSGTPSLTLRESSRTACLFSFQATA